MSSEKKNTPWKIGKWYSKDEHFQLYHLEEDKWCTKNLVSLDYPEVKKFMQGTIEFGDFEPAHNDIKEATGVENYNFVLEDSVMKTKIQGVLNSEGNQIHLWSVFGKMIIVNWLNDEEVEKLKEDREPCEAPTCHYFEPKPEKVGKLLWFSGPPGAGKSTTAAQMAKNEGYIYYEADCFFMYVNPFIDPNAEEASLALAVQKPLKGLDKNTIDILDKASAVEEKMLGGQMEEIEEIMEPMYPLLAKDLIKQRKRLGGDWAIAQAVFSRKQRDDLRSLIGPDLVFIVISMTKECQTQRIKKRHGDNIGAYADAFIKMAELYEPVGEDEKNAYSLVVSEDMSVDDVLKKAKEIIEKL